MTKKLNLNLLNSVQREAVEHISTPLLIVAGAGSGKTMVLTYKIAYLIERGISPENILALTFTNKAAEEMKKRIINLIGEKANYLNMGTFHSVFAKILRRESNLIGYTNNYSIYDSDDSISLIKHIIQENSNLNISNTTPKTIHNKISMAKNKFILPNDERIIMRMSEGIQNIYKLYNQKLQQNNSMDFDDLLIKPIELFNKYENRLNFYRNKFRYILVDEFQDTNYAQYRVLKYLFTNENKIFVVGDDAQSIYKWRGAEVDNVLNYEKDFNNTRVIKLVQNYRSTKSILNVANSVLSNNIFQIQKELWTNNEIGEKIKVIECSDEKNESKYIINEIANLRTQKVSYKDIAILYRTNSQSRVIEESLIHSSIPYIIVSGTEFYRRKEIKDALAYLRLLINPDDSESLNRIINFPNRGIGEITFKKLKDISNSKNISLFNAIDYLIDEPNLAISKKNSLKLFKDKITQNIGKIECNELKDFVQSYLDEIGLIEFYKIDSIDESSDRYENIIQLLNSINEFKIKNPDKGLSEFLQEVSLLSDIDKWDNETECISLMTLHSAKGLEFNTVFIAGCEQGLLPLLRNSSDDDIEEERRLFYVGCTRAKKNLFLLNSKFRNRYGQSARQIKSQFLSELNDAHVEYLHYPKKYVNKFDNISKFTRPSFDEFSQIMPNYDDSQEQQNLRVGLYVQHDIFGIGKILKINGWGENVKVEVDFEKNGRRILAVKYANLKMMN